MEPKLKTLTELKIFFSGRWFISLLKMSERGFKWFRLPRLSKIFRQSSYSTLTVRVEINFSLLAFDWFRRAVFFSKCSLSPVYIFLHASSVVMVKLLSILQMRVSFTSTSRTLQAVLVRESLLWTENPTSPSDSARISSSKYLTVSYMNNFFPLSRFSAFSSGPMRTVE